jgi:hypothetical protein
MDARETNDPGLHADSVEGESQAARSARIRTRELGKIPSWYSPWAHLASTTGIGLIVLAVGVFYVRGVKPLEWLVIPGVFLLANIFEWRAHKHVLHRRRWPVQVIYDRHTPIHHMVYTEHDMAMRDPRELRLVLIPAAGVLGVVVTLVPVAAAVGWLLTPNAGWLMLISGGLYMVTYELTHMSYHLRPESFIGRLWLIRVLRRHHARHHDPRLMQKWNFNVTVPLFDFILGTIAPPSLEGDLVPVSDAAPATDTAQASTEQKPRDPQQATDKPDEEKAHAAAE